MAKHNPKKDINYLPLTDAFTGDMERARLMQEPMEDTTGFYRTVEYEDIDLAMLEFVDNEIPLESSRGKAPTFTLLSNQRFSEYSQTWRHTDREGNLLMDFKTVNRELDPAFGTAFEMHNIPGDRRYTLFTKTVADPNGVEHYEVHSVGQPMPIDLVYSVNYATSKVEKINTFNLKVNELFRAIQYYIKPNGFYMPAVLDSMSDTSEYSIDNRKIFIQTASMTVHGYIIPKDSYRIDMFPKRIDERAALEGGGKKHTYIDQRDGGGYWITIELAPGAKRVEFEYLEDSAVRAVIRVRENVRDIRVYVDGEKVRALSDGFMLSPGCSVRVEVTRIDPRQSVEVKFEGMP